MEDNRVNLYFVPNTKNENGGQFYNLYINRGERLDLKPFLESIDGEIDDLAEEVRKEDKSFKGTGGMILKRDDEFQSVDVYSSNKEEVNISPEQQSIYNSLLELVTLSNQQAQELMKTHLEIQELVNSLQKLNQNKVKEKKLLYGKNQR